MKFIVLALTLIMASCSKSPSTFNLPTDNTLISLEASTINLDLVNNQILASVGESSTSILAGLAAQLPSEMKTSGLSNQVSVDAKRGFGYNLGVTEEFRLSPKYILEAGVYYQEINRGTKTIATQKNQQLHATIGLSYLLD